MTLKALFKNIDTAYHQAGVESDSQVQIKLPNGKLVNIKDCEITEINTSFGRYHKIILTTK